MNWEPDWTLKPLNPRRNIKARCQYCGHLTIVKPTDAPTWQERRRLLVERHAEHMRPACAEAYDERS